MPNQYVNKVVQSNGTTLMDISDTTAVASDVASGKYFYLSTGEKAEGTGSGGGVSRETIVPTTTVSVTAGGWAQLTTGATPSLVAGEYYAYTINGVERVATATAASGTIYLSDIQYDWGGNSFAIAYNGSGILFSASATSGEYTIKVDKLTLSGGGSGTNQDYDDALTAFGVQSNLASGITALTTYANEITGESDTNLSDAVRSLADGYGRKVKTGTFIPSADYKTGGNRLIVSLADIGFTPTKFVLQLADLASVNATLYAVIEASYEKCGDDNTPYYLRKTVRYSNSSGQIGTSTNTTAWTTQTNYYLYNDGINIYMRTTNTFILLKNTVYRWVAYE